VIRFGLLTAALLALAGCAGNTLARQAFPDREMFTFRSDLSKRALSYACTKSATKAETEARAKQAHKAFEAATDTFARDQLLTVMSDKKTPLSEEAFAQKVDREGKAWAEETLEAIDKEYGCFPLPRG
jgi:selenocysteine-specific translation elongation factor